MKKKIILVTGGLGLIGSTLISKFNDIEKEAYIICVESFENNEKWRYLQNLIIDELISVEEFKEKRIEIVEKSDYIFHLGACSSTTEDSWKYLYHKNYRFTIDLIDLFIESKRRNLNKSKKIVIASSASTYGDGNHGFRDDSNELENLRPLNPYAISKHLVDIYLKRNGYLNDVLSVKFFNIFGVNEYHKKNMRSIAHWGVESLIKNKEIKLFKSLNPKYADGKQVRDFLDVDTAIKIMLYLNKHSSGIHNIGCGEAITWDEMACTILNQLKSKVNNLDLVYTDMPKHLIGKYQYYTKAEMTRNTLPEELIPKKENVLNKLAKYSLEIYEDYYSNLI